MTTLHGHIQMRGARPCVRDSVKVDLTHSASWDLFRFPFDEQTIRARLLPLDERSFARREAFTSARLSVTLPPKSSHDLESLYTNDDW